MALLATIAAATVAVNALGFTGSGIAAGKFKDKVTCRERRAGSLQRYHSETLDDNPMEFYYHF